MTDDSINSTPDNAPTRPERILRIGDVCALVGAPETSLRRWINMGHFPRPVKIGPKDSQGTASGWLASEVAEWLDRCKARRDADTLPAIATGTANTAA